MRRLGIVAVGLALVVGMVAGFPGPSTASAQITQIIDSMGDGAGNTLDGPTGIAVDGSGNVYVAGYASDNAFKITSGGGVITEIIDSMGDGTGNTLSFPESMAVDGKGNVYVAGYGSSNAFKITPLTVGGIAELPAVAGTGTSGMGGATYAVLAGAAAGVLAYAVLATLSVRRWRVRQRGRPVQYHGGKPILIRVLRLPPTALTFGECRHLVGDSGGGPGEACSHLVAGGSDGLLDEEGDVPLVGVGFAPPSHCPACDVEVFGQGVRQQPITHL